MAGHGRDLTPAPRGWLEKAFDANIGFILPAFIFLAAFSPLREALGYLSAFAIVVLSGIASLLVLRQLVAPVRKRRSALDAEKGFFECALREKESTSYKGKWAMGYVKAEPGQLVFQAKTGMTGPLFGPVDTYSGIQEIGHPIKAPWSVLPRGRLITLGTDQGTVELATTTSGLGLLTKKIRADGT
ncbi:hypothetical protein [Paenarthrobacter sp. PH39-S1]|uniref:hypothetical protein n=1 Tax=Paenarthrobacter sp. PH39-S1 TaxID=3046204 RepID=UPI0024BB97C6|nr:hypothetical protein [Paenarthrobacter sp. PH39-S1]MDJ0355954.1 hypothetical protein [Paenarthrobacter sp. PH39-S1]